MKTTVKRLSTVAGLLLLVLAWPGRAMPPIPHTFKGGIQSIDVQSRELVITNSQARIVLSWNDTTRVDGSCLNPSDRVMAHYRKEAGRPVAREIRAVGPTICSACCN